MKRIDIARGDAPEFIGKVDDLLAGLIDQHGPTQLYLIRVDGWFGSRWLKFSGKILGALGVARSELTVPPFVPSRIVAQHVLSAPDYGLSRTEAPIHLEQPSTQNLQRRVADLFPDSSFLWFSGDTARNQRGSTMAYIAKPDGYWLWYAGWVDRNPWCPADVRGISHRELETLAMGNEDR